MNRFQFGHPNKINHAHIRVGYTHIKPWERMKAATWERDVLAKDALLVTPKKFLPEFLTVPSIF